MPQIQAFHGLRYDLGHVGSLSDVLAPPYDVIDSQLQDQLYKRHPCNVVRLILNRDEPGDDEDSSRYQRAARHLKNWRHEGVLQPEPSPAVYVYHQTFVHDGVDVTRRGFMCRVRLEPFGEGNIYPHEETHSAAKADRLRLTQAARANLSPIFGLYPDPSNAAQQLLEDAILGQTPLEARDDLGVIHRMWPVSDVKVIAELAALVGPKPTYIADGHHRYETACNYRSQIEQEGLLLPEHPANYVLMMCVGMSDPGMVVLPTHRLFRGAAPITSDELIERMGDFFTANVVGEGEHATGDVWTEMELRGGQGTVGLFTRRDNRWTIASITDSGRAELARVASEHGDDWRGLGVSVLHRLVIDTVLDASNLPKPMYVHSVQEVTEGLVRGDTVGRDATGQASSGGHFNLAALVMPASLEHIRTISGHGERMPAKSTYFYPKLLSGLVVNPLD